MTSDVYCPRCGRKLLVDWEFKRAPEIVWRVSYKSERTCPCCGAELEIGHVLVPHFTAEFARLP